MASLRDALGWLPRETDEDKEWVPLLLNAAPLNPEYYQDND